MKLLDVAAELKNLDGMIRRANEAPDPAQNDWAVFRQIERKISSIGALATGLPLSGEVAIRVPVLCPSEPIPAQQLGQLGKFLRARGVRLA